jgi:type IV pilus assembly protein PilE
MSIACISAPRQHGFTLLELVVTLAIVSILIMIGYPVYTQQVLKTHRAQAQVALLDIAGGMERYAATHQTYSGATLANIEMNAYTDSRTYQLEINQANDVGYQLRAVPQGSQTKDDCGVLGLNQLGEKTATGGLAAECW